MTLSTAESLSGQWLLSEEAEYPPLVLGVVACVDPVATVTQLGVDTQGIYGSICLNV